MTASPLPPSASEASSHPPPEQNCKKKHPVLYEICKNGNAFKNALKSYQGSISRTLPEREIREPCNGSSQNLMGKGMGSQISRHVSSWWLLPVAELCVSVV